MAVLKGYNRKFYASWIKKQATWGTLEADADLFPHRVNTEPLGIDPELQDDTDLAGGNEEAMLQDELSRGVAGEIGQNKVRSPFLASMLSFGLGASTDSTVDTSAGRHIIIPYTTDQTLFTFSGLDLFTASYYIAYHNLGIDSFSLSCQRKGWLQASAQLIGSGKHASSGITVGSLGAALTAAQLGPALKAGDMKVFRSVDAGTTVPSTYVQAAENLPGSATDISAKIVDWTWSVKNNMVGDEAFEMGSGLYRARAERDRRSQELSGSVEFEDSTWLGYLHSQNTLALEFNFTSGTLAGAATAYFGAQILFPKVLLTMGKPSGGMGTFKVPFTGKIMYDGTNPTVRVTVFDKNVTGLLQ